MKSILKLIPLMIIVFSIWVLGNTIYLPNNRLADDVIIQDISSPNQVFLDTVSDNFIFTGESFRSNYPIPVPYKSYSGYADQYAMRKEASAGTKFLSTMFWIYITFFFIQMINNFVVNYLYWKQVMAGNKQYGFSNTEVRYTGRKFKKIKKYCKFLLTL